MMVLERALADQRAVTTWLKGMVVAVMAASFLMSCTTANTQADLVISNVTVHTGNGEPGFIASVAVRDGRFVAVSGPEVAIQSSRRVEGAGKFLVPGIWDMHVHARASGRESLDVAAFAKHGVTTVRDMGGYADALRKLQDDAQTNRNMPAIHSSMATLNGKAFAPFQRAVTDEASMLMAIDEQVRAGAVQIKVHRSFPPGLLRQAVQLSHRRALKLTGHIPLGIHPLAACEAGMDGVEHVGSFLEAYISVTPKATPQDALAYMLSEEAADLYQCLAGRKVFVTPTLVLYPAVARARSKAAVPAGTMAFIDGTRRIARRLHDAGVPLLSGTDTSDTGDLDLHPGSALLDELESLQEAGIPPREILKIATGNAAAALGLEGTVGTIEVGKQADFVLLAQDPGADVRALRSPVAVYRRGSQVALPVP